LGFKLVQVEGWLKDFAAFMDTRGETWVTTELALQWAVQPVGGQPATWVKRLTAVRGFARYRSAMDARTEIPEPGLLANRQRRAKPYLYSENEVSNLLAAASTLKSNSGLRGQTYYCLFGLLAVTGLRISEALALQRQDVNLQQGLLTIRGAKFGKSRLVPLHESTTIRTAGCADKTSCNGGPAKMAFLFVKSTACANERSCNATRVHRRLRQYPG